MKIKLAMFAIVFLASTSIFADDVQDKKFLEKVIKKVQEKCAGNKNFLQCRYDNSPRKCKSLSFADSSAWARCVHSCGSAGIISKSIGDCS